MLMAASFMPIYQYIPPLTGSNSNYQHYEDEYFRDFNFIIKYFRKHIALEVGSPGAISLISDPALTSDLFDHSSDLDLDLQPQQFDLQQPEVIIA